MGRLKAALLLAWALLRTLLLRGLGFGRRGLKRFRANYAEDGLAPVEADERERMKDFGRCIACGLCDRGEAQRIVAAQGAYPGVMTLVLAASRSMPDYRAAARAFDYVSDEVLRDKERICPTEVPIRDIAQFVRDKALVGRISLPAARGAKRISSREL